MIGKRLILPRMRARPQATILARQRAAWTRLALTWRRTARAFAPVMSRPGIRPVPWHGWAPHFHLHFAIPAISIASTPRGTLLPRVSTAILWRTINTQVSTRLPLVRDASTVERSGLKERFERQTVTRTNRSTKSGRREVIRHLRSAALPARGLARPVRGQAAAPRQPPAFPGPATAVPGPDRRPAATVLLDRSALNLAPRHPFSPEPCGRFERPPARQFRAPDLIWRTSSDDPSGGAAAYATRVHMASPGPVAALPHATIPQAPPISTDATLRQRMFDPALIDRVAEDVLGRVEKRIRIERERRGV